MDDKQIKLRKRKPRESKSLAMLLPVKVGLVVVRDLTSLHFHYSLVIYYSLVGMLAIT